MRFAPINPDSRQKNPTHNRLLIGGGESFSEWILAIKIAAMKLQNLMTPSGLPQPDPFRMKHRAALGEVVAEIVLQGLAPEESLVRKLTGNLVPAADLDRFVQLVLDELGHLHEGNIARYRLRLSEYRAWRSAQSA